MKIEVIFGDIFAQEVDVIVNPANSEMGHGGGLAAAIAARGGKDLVHESRLLAPVETGEAIVTTAGDLPFKAVIHTVGPIWDDGDHDEDSRLSLAHVNAVLAAEDCGYESIAFPAVSCGIYRFPVERAAPIAIASVRSAAAFAPTVERVVFCLLDDDHFNAFDKALVDAASARA
jgi:O-acetyl-ADP-ribose deacetylase (regulator of RNase III)